MTKTQNPIAKRILSVAGITIAMGSLSACILIAPPPARTFDLSAPIDISRLSGRTGQLLIVEPSALQALSGSGIVVRPSDSEINYFAQAQWADRLPRLVQSKLQESFESTGRTRAVGKPGDGLVIDYQIQSNIRAFELNALTNEAIVDISVKIVNDRTGQVVGAKEFQGTALSASDQIDDAIFAIDEAMDDVIIQIVRWTLRRV